MTFKELQQKEGERPACVKHCQSRCREFGFLRDLVLLMEERSKMALFAPR